MSSEHDSREHKRMATTMQLLLWLVLLGLGVLLFGDRLEEQLNPNRTLQSRYAADGAVEVTLKRNRFGHYVTSGEINGEPVTFMLDTGATGVAIPEPVARTLRLQRGPAQPVRTANGTTVSYATRLDEVSVGGIAVEDVRAGIVPGLAGDEVLLGMSFLKHVEFTQRGDTLTLRQAGPR